MGGQSNIGAGRQRDEDRARWRRAAAKADLLSAQRVDVAPVEHVREVARWLVRVHDLRGADARVAER